MLIKKLLFYAIIPFLFLSGCNTAGSGDGENTTAVRASDVGPAIEVSKKDNTVQKIVERDSVEVKKSNATLDISGGI